MKKELLIKANEITGKINNIEENLKIYRTFKNVEHTNFVLLTRDTYVEKRHVYPEEKIYLKLKVDDTITDKFLEFIDFMIKTKNDELEKLTKELESL